MQKEYVKAVEGTYRIGDTRVSLYSLIYLFREGISAEGMVESHPALTLEQVHGALAFYLANQKEIDAYLVEGRARLSRITSNPDGRMPSRSRNFSARVMRVRFQADR